MIVAAHGHIHTHSVPWRHINSGCCGYLHWKSPGLSPASSSRGQKFESKHACQTDWIGCLFAILQGSKSIIILTRLSRSLIDTSSWGGGGGGGGGSVGFRKAICRVTMWKPLECLQLNQVLCKIEWTKRPSFTPISRAGFGTEDRRVQGGVCLGN